MDGPASRSPQRAVTVAGRPSGRLGSFHEPSVDVEDDQLRSHGRVFAAGAKQWRCVFTELDAQHLAHKQCVRAHRQLVA